MPRRRRCVSRSRSAGEEPLRAEPFRNDPFTSILWYGLLGELGESGELGAMRVERSLCAPLSELRWLLREVDGVEVMVVSMYTGCLVLSGLVIGVDVSSEQR
jgi:hypothetical protein